jgi:hypothetical protein
MVAVFSPVVVVSRVGTVASDKDTSFFVPSLITTYSFPVLMFGTLPIENVWLYPENSSFSILGLLPPQDVRQKIVVNSKQIKVKRPIPSFFIVSSFFIIYFFQNTELAIE